MLTRVGNIFIVYLRMLSVAETIYRRNDEKFMGQAVERSGLVLVYEGVTKARRKIIRDS
jgi:hypothetical protein